MSESKSKTPVAMTIAILSLALVSQINTIASVLMADIAAAFPGASATAVQYVMQCGMIGAFPIQLAVGFLSKKFRVKSMVITGLILIIVGGMIPVFSHGTLMILYISALLVGAGQGFLAPLLGMLIHSTYTGATKDRILGLNTTFSTGGSTLLLLIAGAIVAKNWVNVYWLYLLAVPVLIITLLFLDAGEKPSAMPAPTQSGKKSATVPATGWINSLLTTIMYVAYVSFPLNVAMYIVDEGLGTAGASSIAMSIVTVLGAVVGLVFQPIVKKVKMYIGAFSAIFGVVGMGLMVVGTNLTMVYIAAALVGIFFGAQITGGTYMVGRICTPEQVGPTMSIQMSAMTLGIILSPIIVNGLTSLWGGVGPKGAFITSTAIYAVGFVLQIIWGAYLTRTTSETAVKAKI